ncbi:MAG TPA: hypothetical protein VJ718_03375, partial [Candidatus Binataceae bacterium]|nr:hypothetical protein [Candidatus Binataceae bacterium]
MCERIRRVGTLAAALALALLALPGASRAEDGASASDLQSIRQQIDKIKYDEAAQRERVESDEALIRRLDQQLERLQSQNASLVSQSRALQATNANLKADTDAQLRDIQERLAKGPGAGQFGSWMDAYLGTHQFTWNGAVAGSFVYDRGNNVNTFALTFEPLVIYRLNDWISFVG